MQDGLYTYGDVVRRRDWRTTRYWFIADPNGFDETGKPIAFAIALSDTPHFQAGQRISKFDRTEGSLGSEYICTVPDFETAQAAIALLGLTN